MSLFKVRFYFSFCISELDNLLGDTQCEITGMLIPSPAQNEERTVSSSVVEVYDRCT